ncbi:MAG: hypothetical protein M3119_03880 [Verrucomicrobiota bacterium]|nr:hypothetical protein [Verrucomicrobiota bacterium]
MEILKPSLISSLITLTAISSGFCSDVRLQKVPPLAVEQTPAYPENLARYHLGAQVEAAPQSRPIANLQLSSNSEDKNAAEAALLCDDPTVGYALPAGTTTILVSLPKIENVGRLSFLNQGTTGDVAIATSSAKLPMDSPQWHTVVQESLSANGLQTSLGPTDAKYIRLTFNVNQPGRLAGFGVYSTGQISDFTAPRARKLSVQDKSDSFALISYSLADIHAKARALYVSSGNEPRQANNMIDDQPATVYNFAAEDATPTAVFDLGKPSTVRRISAVYSPRAGKVDFYVLQSLPRGASPTAPAPESIELNDVAFASLKSVGSVTDDGTRGRASLDFPATTGRYVMMRWTPSTQADSAFAVAEVAAFGSGKVNTLLAANENAGGGYEGDGKTLMDGKTMLEAKDMAESPAEAAPPAEGPPPSLPQPPPFTFVPVLVPISR